jgi:hypothetical protein
MDRDSTVVGLEMHQREIAVLPPASARPEQVLRSAPGEDRRRRDSGIVVRLAIWYSVRRRSRSRRAERTYGLTRPCSESTVAMRLAI